MCCMGPCTVGTLQARIIAGEREARQAQGVESQARLDDYPRDHFCGCRCVSGEERDGEEARASSDMCHERKRRCGFGESREEGKQRAQVLESPAQPSRGVLRC